MTDEVYGVAQSEASRLSVFDFTDDELLDLYLALPNKQRQEKFVDTAQAAEFAGISQRTIQLWIEIGTIRAVPIGKKYRVHLHSLREYLKTRVDR